MRNCDNCQFSNSDSRLNPCFSCNTNENWQPKQPVIRYKFIDDSSSGVSLVNREVIFSSFEDKEPYQKSHYWKMRNYAIALGAALVEI